MSEPAIPPPLPASPSPAPNSPPPRRKLSPWIIALICVAGFIFLLIPLGILAGLMLPALSNAKSRAHQITCVNNLKQLGLACRIYSVDHDEKYPKSWDEIRAEISTPAVLVCPSLADRGSIRTFEQALAASNYAYLGAGASETNVQQVIAVCPIHGNTLYADGSVMQARGAQR